MPSRPEDLYHNIRQHLPHRANLMYASWLNQVEIWLSLLVRKLLKRGSFTSVDDLQTKLLAFIAYYNRTMAKPFKWTYQGQALLV